MAATEARIRKEAAMNITQRDRDLGTGYAMKPSTSRTELTKVGAGTPMGELLRRYWHPVGSSLQCNAFKSESAR